MGKENAFGVRKKEAVIVRASFYISGIFLFLEKFLKKSWKPFFYQFFISYKINNGIKW